MSRSTHERTKQTNDATNHKHKCKRKKRKEKMHTYIHVKTGETNQPVPHIQPQKKHHRHAEYTVDKKKLLWQ